MIRRCEQCRGPMPLMARAHAVTCSPRCRKRRSRAVVLPAELRAAPRWVTHTPAKVPTQPDGSVASSTDPRTWSPFALVESLPRRGFVLADADRIVCADLDHCLVDGRVADWAARILDMCPSTYVEVSQSGTGLHIFGHATLDGGRVIRDHRCVEVYGSGRYIAVTGRVWRGAPSRLADISALVEGLAG